MEELGKFVMEMTVWNWLAVIAFLFACVSVLNAVLGLRTRYKDWRAVTSQKKFSKRVGYFIGVYKFGQLLSAKDIAARTAHSLMFVLICLSGSIFCLGVAIYLQLIGFNIMAGTLTLTSVGFFISSLGVADKAITEASSFYSPSSTVDGTIDLLNQGLKKGLSVDVAEALNPVITDSYWTTVYRTAIREQAEHLKKQFGARAGATPIADIPVADQA